MLEIYRYGERIETPCALVLGGFDGLHAGHRTLVDSAKKTGLLVGITTMLGGKDGAMFSREERAYIFEKAGVDFVYEIALTEAFKRTSAENFLKVIFDKIPVERVFCGEDFRFGIDASGTPDFLKQIAPCPVEIVPLVEKDGKKLSTSACKHLLKTGNLHDLSADYLDYFVQSVVEHGREVGRTLGFPTVNLTVPAEKLLPADGVYGGFAETPSGTFPAIINIGARPTFEVAERKIEAYLDGFSGDLYGKTVRIYPTEYYRAIKKFASVRELTEQLEKDIRKLRNTHD